MRPLIMKFFKIMILVTSILFFPKFINATESSAYDLSDIDTEDTNEVPVNDPLENFNRGVFQFNKVLDKAVLKPAASMYHDLTPSWGRDRMTSFFQNLREPVNLANAVLQGNIPAAGNCIGRFITNTLLGLGGIFDVAHQAREDLKPMQIDFGLTLKSYGADIGPYLVLPVIGPSSFRDAPSLLADYALDPFNHYAKRKLIIAKSAGNLLVTREQLLEALDKIEETSLDEYSSIRSIYFQKRN
jgi:phospholipid-binding lipoprotein MlaA